MDSGSWDLLTRVEILQDCFTGTGAISEIAVKYMGKLHYNIQQTLQIMCIFLGIYCTHQIVHSYQVTIARCYINGGFWIWGMASLQMQVSNEFSNFWLSAIDQVNFGFVSGLSSCVWSLGNGLESVDQRKAMSRCQLKPKNLKNFHQIKRNIEKQSRESYLRV